MTTLTERADECNDGRSRFTDTDLANLAAIARGGPMDEHRFNVSAAEDFLEANADLSPAEAMIELLRQIRTA